MSANHLEPSQMSILIMDVMIAFSSILILLVDWIQVVLHALRIGFLGRMLKSPGIDFQG